MATPRKDLSRYGRDTFQFFYFLRWTGKAVIRYSSREVAVRARGRLYAFRTAFLSQPDYKPDLTRVVTMMKMRIKDNALILEYANDRAEPTAFDNFTITNLSRSRRLDDAGRIR